MEWSYEVEAPEMSNLIIRFGSEDSRQAFVQRVNESWPELSARIYAPKRRPDTIVEQLSDEDMQRVRDMVGADGKIFEDVKFEPMEPR